MPIKMKYFEGILSGLQKGKVILPQPRLVLMLLVRSSSGPPHIILGEQEITFSSWYYLLFVKGFYVAGDSDMWI